MEQQAFTIPEFLSLYRIGRSTAYAEIKAGRLKIVKIGRATRITLPNAKEWLQALEAETSGQREVAQ
jgi:hypothetical protein